MLKVFLISGIVLLLGCVLDTQAADVLVWPESHNIPKVIYAPYARRKFVDQKGMARLRVKFKDFSRSVLRIPHYPWIKHQSCNLPAREPGYIQTTPYVNDVEDLLEIAVPIQVKLVTSFLGEKKEALLNSPLLKISIYEVDTEEYKLSVHSQYSFTVKQLCQLDYGCQYRIDQANSPISLNLRQPIVTPPFHLEGNKEVRIRVEWTFSGICDEDSFEFKVGDQVRILSVIN